MEIIEIYNLVRDPVTQRLTQFGEAAQMQAHFSDGINRVRMVERIALAKHLAGATTLDIRSDLPTGNRDNPALDLAIAGEGPGNRDSWGIVHPAGTYGSAAARLSPANRALAMCIVAIHDEITDIKAKAESSRIADNLAFQASLLKGSIEVEEINNWMAARSAAVKAQARRDIDALGNGIALPALGEEVGQEGVSTDTINMLISKRVYDNVRSRLAAQTRFDAQHFAEIVDIRERLKAVSEALKIAGSGNAAIHDFPINASRVYRELLTRELTKLNASISAAKAQFQLHNFEEVDLASRRKAITAAQAAVGSLELAADTAQVYNSLLVEALVDIDAAEALFNSHRFADIDRVLIRRKAVVEAQTLAGLPNTIVQSLSLSASQIYRSLLSQELVRVEASIAAGQARFGSHHFASMSDYIARRQAIVTAQTAVAGLGLAPDVAQIYNSLLEQEFAKIDSCIKIGQGCFDEHHFSEISNVVTRRQAIVAAQVDVASLELSPDAVQFYSNLLAQELARVDLIVASIPPRRPLSTILSHLNLPAFILHAAQGEQPSKDEIEAKILQEQQRLAQAQAAIPSSYSHPRHLYLCNMTRNATNLVGQAGLDRQRADIEAQAANLNTAQRELKLASEVESVQERGANQAEQERIAKLQAEVDTAKAAQQRAAQQAQEVRAAEEQRRQELEQIKRDMAAWDACRPIGYSGGI